MKDKPINDMSEFSILERDSLPDMGISNDEALLLNGLFNKLIRGMSVSFWKEKSHEELVAICRTLEERNVLPTGTCNYLSVEMEERYLALNDTNPALFQRIEEQISLIVKKYKPIYAILLDTLKDISVKDNVLAVNQHISSLGESKSTSRAHLLLANALFEQLICVPGIQYSWQRQVAACQYWEDEGVFPSLMHQNMTVDLVQEAGVLLREDASFAAKVKASIDTILPQMQAVYTQKFSSFEINQDWEIGSEGRLCGSAGLMDRLVILSGIPVDDGLVLYGLLEAIIPTHTEQGIYLTCEERAALCQPMMESNVLPKGIDQYLTASWDTEYQKLKLTARWEAQDPKLGLGNADKLHEIQSRVQLEISNYYRRISVTGQMAIKLRSEKMNNLVDSLNKLIAIKSFESDITEIFTTLRASSGDQESFDAVVDKSKKYDVFTQSDHKIMQLYGAEDSYFYGNYIAFSIKKLSPEEILELPKKLLLEAEDLKISVEILCKRKTVDNFHHEIHEASSTVPESAIEIEIYRQTGLTLQEFANCVNSYSGQYPNGRLRGITRRQLNLNNRYCLMNHPHYWILMGILKPIDPASAYNTRYALGDRVLAELEYKTATLERRAELIAAAKPIVVEVSPEMMKPPVTKNLANDRLIEVFQRYNNQMTMADLVNEGYHDAQYIYTAVRQGKLTAVSGIGLTYDFCLGPKLIALVEMRAKNSESTTSNVGEPKKPKRSMAEKIVFSESDTISEFDLENRQISPENMLTRIPIDQIDINNSEYQRPIRECLKANSGKPIFINDGGQISREELLAEIKSTKEKPFFAALLGQEPRPSNFDPPTPVELVKSKAASQGPFFAALLGRESLSVNPVKTADIEKEASEKSASIQEESKTQLDYVQDTSSKPTTSSGPTTRKSVKKSIKSVPHELKNYIESDKSSSVVNLVQEVPLASLAQSLHALFTESKNVLMNQLKILRQHSKDKAADVVLKAKRNVINLAVAHKVDNHVSADFFDYTGYSQYQALDYICNNADHLVFLEGISSPLTKDALDPKYIENIYSTFPNGPRIPWFSYTPAQKKCLIRADAPMIALAFDIISHVFPTQDKMMEHHLGRLHKIGVARELKSILIKKYDHCAVFTEQVVLMSIWSFNQIFTVNESVVLFNDQLFIVNAFVPTPIFVTDANREGVERLKTKFTASMHTSDQETLALIEQVSGYKRIGVAEYKSARSKAYLHFSREYQTLMRELRERTASYCMHRLMEEYDKPGIVDFGANHHFNLGWANVTRVNTTSEDAYNEMVEARTAALVTDGWRAYSEILTQFEPYQGALNVGSEDNKNTLTLQDPPSVAQSFNTHLPKMRYLYRGDSRPPDQIFAEGFTARGTNTDLFAHVNLSDHAERESAYIATSTSKKVASTFPGGLEMHAFVYEINAQEAAIVINEDLSSDMKTKMSPKASEHYRAEKEIAVPYKIKPQDIKGAWPVELTKVKGKYKYVIQETFILNPSYMAPEKGDTWLSKMEAIRQSKFLPNESAWHAKIFDNVLEELGQKTIIFAGKNNYFEFWEYSKSSSGEYVKHRLSACSPEVKAALQDNQLIAKRIVNNVLVFGEASAQLERSKQEAAIKQPFVSSDMPVDPWSEKLTMVRLYLAERDIKHDSVMEIIPGVHIERVSRTILYSGVLEQAILKQALINLLHEQGLVYKTLEITLLDATSAQYDFECYPIKLTKTVNRTKVVFNLLNKLPNQMPYVVGVAERGGRFEEAQHLRFWTDKLSHQDFTVDKFYQLVEVVNTQYANLGPLYRISKFDTTGSSRRLKYVYTAQHEGRSFDAYAKTYEFSPMESRTKEHIQEVVDFFSPFGLDSIGSFSFYNTTSNELDSKNSISETKPSSKSMAASHKSDTIKMSEEELDRISVLNEQTTTVNEAVQSTVEAKPFASQMKQSTFKDETFVTANLFALFKEKERPIHREKIIKELKLSLTQFNALVRTSRLEQAKDAYYYQLGESGLKLLKDSVLLTPQGTIDRISRIVSDFNGSTESLSQFLMEQLCPLGREQNKIIKGVRVQALEQNSFHYQIIYYPVSYYPDSEKAVFHIAYDPHVHRGTLGGIDPKFYFIRNAKQAEAEGHWEAGDYFRQIAEKQRNEGSQPISSEVLKESIEAISNQYGVVLGDATHFSSKVASFHSLPAGMADMQSRGLSSQLLFCNKKAEIIRLEHSYQFYSKEDLQTLLTEAMHGEMLSDNLVSIWFQGVTSLRMEGKGSILDFPQLWNKAQRSAWRFPQQEALQEERVFVAPPEPVSFIDAVKPLVINIKSRMESLDKHFSDEPELVTLTNGSVEHKAVVMQVLSALTQVYNTNPLLVSVLVKKASEMNPGLADVTMEQGDVEAALYKTIQNILRTAYEVDHTGKKVTFKNPILLEQSLPNKELTVDRSASLDAIQLPTREELAEVFSLNPINGIMTKSDIIEELELNDLLFEQLVLKGQLVPTETGNGYKLKDPSKLEKSVQPSLKKTLSKKYMAESVGSSSISSRNFTDHPDKSHSDSGTKPTHNDIDHVHDIVALIMIRMKTNPTDPEIHNVVSTAMERLGVEHLVDEFATSSFTGDADNATQRHHDNILFISKTAEGITIQCDEPKHLFIKNKIPANTFVTRVVQSMLEFNQFPLGDVLPVPRWQQNHVYLDDLVTHKKSTSTSSSFKIDWASEPQSKTALISSKPTSVEIASKPSAIPSEQISKVKNPLVPVGPRMDHSDVHIPDRDYRNTLHIETAAEAASKPSAIPAKQISKVKNPLVPVGPLMDYSDVYIPDKDYYKRLLKKEAAFKKSMRAFEKQLKSMSVGIESAQKQAAGTKQAGLEGIGAVYALHLGGKAGESLADHLDIQNETIKEVMGSTGSAAMALPMGGPAAVGVAAFGALYVISNYMKRNPADTSEGLYWQGIAQSFVDVGGVLLSPFAGICAMMDDAFLGGIQLADITDRGLISPERALKLIQQKESNPGGFLQIVSNAFQNTTQPITDAVKHSIVQLGESLMKLQSAADEIGIPIAAGEFSYTGAIPIHENQSSPSIIVIDPMEIQGEHISENRSFGRSAENVEVADNPKLVCKQDRSKHHFVTPNYISVDSISTQKDGVFLYIITEKEQLKIASEKGLTEDLSVSHTDLARGRTIMSAGKITIQDGEIVHIDNHAPDYKLHHSSMTSSLQETTSRVFHKSGFSNIQGKFVDREMVTEQPPLTRADVPTSHQAVAYGNLMLSSSQSFFGSTNKPAFGQEASMKSLSKSNFVNQVDYSARKAAFNQTLSKSSEMKPVSSASTLPRYGLNKTSTQSALSLFNVSRTASGQTASLNGATTVGQSENSGRGGRFQIEITGNGMGRSGIKWSTGETEWSPYL